MTQAVSGAGLPAVGSSTEASGSGLKALTTEDFLEMLITQLTHQDPTNPMDNREILQQLGTIQEMESNRRLVDAIEDLTLQYRIGAGAALLGREVVGLDEAGSRVAGLVAGVAVGENDVSLRLLDPTGAEQRVWLSRVLEVREAEAEAGGAGGV